jgi:hypothetical protein
MFNNKIEGMDQVPKLNFGLKDTTSVECTECKCNVFQNGVIFRKVSKILAGTDKDALVPITIPYCVNCLEPLNELLPSELKKPNLIQ